MNTAVKLYVTISYRKIWHSEKQQIINLVEYNMNTSVNLYVTITYRKIWRSEK